MTALKFINMGIVTVFGLGFLPAPGTFGSLAGIVIILFIKEMDRIISLNLLIISALFLISVPSIETVLSWLRGGESAFLKTKIIRPHQMIDPGFIVIDEVIGQLVTILIISLFHIKLTPIVLLLSFIFFRIFDIFKPFPIKQMEKRLEQFQKLQTLSIIIDDIVAGIFSGIILASIFIFRN